MTSVKFITIVLALLAFNEANAQDLTIIRHIRECLKGPTTVVCLKEKALKIIDEAMISEKPLKVMDMVDIVRNPNYVANKTDLQELPRDLKERNEMLNDMLIQKVDEFFQSRTVKFNLANIFKTEEEEGMI